VNTASASALGTDSHAAADGTQVPGDLFGCLANIDTLYGFGRVIWKTAIAEQVHAASLKVEAPRMRDFLHRRDSMLAQVDPVEAERLASLPFEDFRQKMREWEADTRQDLGPDGDASALPFTSIELGGKTFKFIGASPRRGCTFTLEGNGASIHGRLGAGSKMSPNIYIEIGSAPFWDSRAVPSDVSDADDAPGWHHLLMDWHAWLAEVAKPLQNKDICPHWHVSRVDLCFHTQAINPEHLDHAFFRCRAETRKIYTKSDFLYDVEQAKFADDRARSDGKAPCNVSRVVAEHRKKYNDLCDYVQWAIDTDQALGVGAENIEKTLDELNNDAGAVTVTHLKGDKVQMITFGKRGRLYSRIYDKTVQTARSKEKSALFREVWERAGFNLDNHVINVEFEISRAWLGSRQLLDGQQNALVIDTFFDLLRHYDALTSYLLGTPTDKGWLTMINPVKTLAGNDQRKTRCDTHEAWHAFRQVLKVLPAISGAERDREKVRKTAAQVMPQVVRLMAALNYRNNDRREPEDMDYEFLRELLSDFVEHIRHERDAIDIMANLSDVYRAETAQRAFQGVAIRHVTRSMLAKAS
jgi:hypothetical protein